jgi:hypothetical protein
MAAQRTLLLIADISGYTRYLRTHRMSLAHAEVNLTRLLEAVIDAAPGFDLIEIEGDAAFLARRADPHDDGATADAMARAVAAMHRAFHRERRYVASNLCPCAACEETNDMKLKFVAHVGEVADQTIRNRRKLVGIDVILVHRLLKNAVEDPEYVLMSDELYRAAGPAFEPVRALVQELEGLGTVVTYVARVEGLAGSPAPVAEPGLLQRLGRTVDVASRGMPYMLGLRRRRRPVLAG